jgi:hypothetical protein
MDIKLPIAGLPAGFLPRLQWAIFRSVLTSVNGRAPSRAEHLRDFGYNLLSLKNRGVLRSLVRLHAAEH